MKGRTVDVTGLCIHRINIVVDGEVDQNVRGRPGTFRRQEMPARCLLCICFPLHAYTVMSTRSAYRAILRELYKAVCILPHSTLVILTFMYF